jgi:hypothetical protein
MDCMEVSMSRIVLAVALASAIPACTLDDQEPVSSTDQALRGWNRLAGNRLAGNRLAGNRLAGNRLAGNSLSSTRLEALAETAEILQSVEGRDVYSYIVSCALEPGITIEYAVSGVADTAPPTTPYTCSGGVCTFPGGLGIAPGWKDKKLDTAGRGWISACLFARVNANDTAEQISLRGRNPALAVSAEEADDYSLEEGGFYGNLFTDAPESEPPDWHACRGEAQAAGETGGLALRDCAEENPANPGFTYCGFYYAGDCRDYTPDFPSAYACKNFDAGQGIYGDCHEDAGNKSGSWPGGNKKYRQVITTFVSP